MDAFVNDFICIATAFVIAVFVAYFLTPVIARLAVKVGAIDRPDGHRKCQTHAVPRAGGVAVALAGVFAVAAVIGMLTPTDNPSSALLWHGLLPALSILILVGIVDDVLTLTGIYKLIGQVLAVSVLVAAGTQFDRVSLFGILIPLGDLRIPFTIFFCLGAINAFNLIDGADGLASSIGAIISLALGVITLSRGDMSAALICFALAGALIGFLRHNISPARVYLGDTGSMLIGLIVAAVAIDCSIKQEAAFVLAVPLALCAIPLLDAAAALVRRVTTGQSVFTPDRGHLHHALLLRGWSVNKTVFAMTGLTAITCAGALASFFTNRDLIAVAVAGGVLITLTVARVFGHVEVGLIASHSASITRSMLSRGSRGKSPDSERAVQLQGSRKWRNLWSALREAAPTYNLTGLTLQISMPHLHESFHASWKSNGSSAAQGGWRVAVPLKLEERKIGKLTLVGGSDGMQALADMRQVLDFLDPLHAQIAELIDDEQRVAAADWPAAAPAPTFHLGHGRPLEPAS